MVENRKRLRLLISNMGLWRRITHTYFCFLTAWCPAFLFTGSLFGLGVVRETKAMEMDLWSTPPCVVWTRCTDTARIKVSVVLTAIGSEPHLNKIDVYLKEWRLLQSNFLFLCLQQESHHGSRIKIPQVFSQLGSGWFCKNHISWC